MFALALITRLMQMIDEHGLNCPSYTTKYGFVAFQASLLIGDIDKAMGWIIKVYDAYVISHGADHDLTKQMAEFKANPLSMFG